MATEQSGLVMAAPNYIWDCIGLKEGSDRQTVSSEVLKSRLRETLSGIRSKNSAGSIQRGCRMCILPSSVRRIYSITFALERAHFRLCIGLEFDILLIGLENFMLANGFSPQNCQHINNPQTCHYPLQAYIGGSRPQERGERNEGRSNARIGNEG